MNTFTKIGLIFLMVGSSLSGQASKRIPSLDVPKNNRSRVDIAVWQPKTAEPVITSFYSGWSAFRFADFGNYFLKPFTGKKLVHYTATTAGGQMLGVRPVQTGLDNGKSKLLPTVNAFPNPSKGKFTISLTQTAGDIYKIRISNTIGRVIQTIKVEDNAQAADVMIDLSDRPAGIYFYSLLVNDKMIETKRLVLQQ